MYNNDLYKNVIYYVNYLTAFNAPFKENIESLTQEDFYGLMEYLGVGIKCFYTYLCSNDYDEVLANRVTEILDKWKTVIGEKQLGIYSDAINNLKKFNDNVRKYKKHGKKVPHIIFLIGNPGSGKSHIARMLDEEKINIEVVAKYTTRARRIDEENVTETKAGISIDEISKMKYKFQFTMGKETNWCGIDENDIITALQEGKNPVIATTSLDLYHQIVQDFPCQTHLIQINNLTHSTETQRKIFESQGRTAEEIENRLGKSVVDDIKKYDYNLRVLINHITGLKFASELERKNFIYSQLKRIFEEFGCEFKLDFEPSGVLNFYDQIYTLTMSVNGNNLYPYLSGEFDENVSTYFNAPDIKIDKKYK